VGFSFFLAFVWLGLVVDGHWFVVAVLGGAVMGGCGVRGKYITELVGFLGSLGISLIAWRGQVWLGFFLLCG